MLRSLVRQATTISRVAVRGLSTAQPASGGAASTEQKVDKQALMKLRKSTGYSYVNCRKALLQFGSNNLSDAEKWLRQNAEKEGWAKAAKLSSRQTSQGLVSVLSSGSVAAVVELNCETDFVSRGDAFKELLSTLVTAVLSHAEKNIIGGGEAIARQSYDVESVSTPDGKSLKEVIAMGVGRLGENITAKRVEAFFAPNGAQLHAGAHPKEGTDAVHMGKFVSLIALSRPDVAGQFPTEKLAAQICQHIIGMRSETLGAPPTSQGDKKEEKQTADNQDELNDFFKGQTTEIDADETALLRQAFMLNPSQTIYEYVTGHNAKILDFARVELGGEKSDD